MAAELPPQGPQFQQPRVGAQRTGNAPDREPRRNPRENLIICRCTGWDGCPYPFACGTPQDTRRP